MYATSSFVRLMTFKKDQINAAYLLIDCTQRFLQHKRIFYCATKFQSIIKHAIRQTPLDECSSYFDTKSYP